MPIEKRRILITGACGFTGRHLIARLARERPSAIIGLDITEPGNSEPIGWEYSQCDLTDADAVDRTVSTARPDTVFHLAGVVRAASRDAFYRVNVDGSANLWSAVRRTAERRGSPVRLITIGSAAELGFQGASRLPVTEEAVCAPRSGYGRSKWEATRRAIAQPADGPLRIVVARTFNLIGPGQDEGSAPGTFARQVLAVVAGQSKAVHCGNLEPRRDFVDVRDAVDAYVTLARSGRPGQIYNVCAGRSYRIGDLLKHLVDHCGGNIPVVPDPSRVRRDDLADIYGDRTKITEETGWRPRIPIAQSLEDLLASQHRIRHAA